MAGYLKETNNKAKKDWEKKENKKKGEPRERKAGSEGEPNSFSPFFPSNENNKKKIRKKGKKIATRGTREEQRARSFDFSFIYIYKYIFIYTIYK